MDQRGNPQGQRDWTDPDIWIAERLDGDQRMFALRIWRESNQELNPRYLRGPWYMTTKHDLLIEGDEGILQVTERGKRFLEHPEGLIVAEIDSYEGILTILQIVAEKGPGKRSDLLPGFVTFCQAHTSYNSETVMKMALYDRLVNLIARGYVLRRSQAYEVTDAGLAYLERYAQLLPGRKAGDKHSNLHRLMKSINEEAREQLAAYLLQMDPFKFEELIKFLLEEMGYTDVETTSPTHDKGVDVTANIDLGISSVREVIQVKRYRGNINRTVLDQLRGSLHRFDAVRGTIITTGGFSRGTMNAAFERGAAPITLIDAEKLLDLLIEYEIGVTKNRAEYIDFDASRLTQFESTEEEVLEV
jgi:restriction system protein